MNIAKWNLCLGIANKKDTFTAYLTANEIQICCLQETGIPMGFPDNLLNCNGYYIELEMNSLKKGVGIYIQRNINYIRRTDLEKHD